MLSCLRDLATFKEQIAQIDMAIEVIWIELQRLPILRNRLVRFAVLFKESTIAIVRLRGARRQADGRLTFNSRFVLAAKLVQEIRVAGMIFSVVRLDPQCLFEMLLCVIELPIRRQ